MGRYKERQPREFLARLHYQSLPPYPKNAPEWWEAAKDVCAMLALMYHNTDPDPPKRSYYGAKGSTRNPFRS